MPTPLSSLPPEIAGRDFTVAEARERGVSTSRLRHGSLARPHHGVRAARPADDLVGRARELLPLLPPDAVFSHATGLDLWDVDLPRGLRRPQDLHVEVLSPRAQVRRPGVVGHRRSDDPPIVDRYGLPVPTVERLWTQVAGELTVEEVVVAGDALLRRGQPRTSVEALAEAVARLPRGVRGSSRLRAALPLLAPGTDSCMETRQRLAIIRSGLPCPEVNRAVRRRDGAFVALPDLSYPHARVVVEYDGDVHRTDPRTWRRDIARRQAMEALGWRVVTCTADDVRHPDRATGWIRAALRRSGIE